MLSLAEVSMLNPMSLPMMTAGIIMLIISLYVIFLVKGSSSVIFTIAAILCLVMIGLPASAIIYGYTETKTITPCNILGNLIVDTSDNMYLAGSTDVLLRTHINTTVDVQIIWAPYNSYPVIVNTTGKICSGPIKCYYG